MFDEAGGQDGQYLSWEYGLGIFSLHDDEYSGTKVHGQLAMLRGPY